MSGTHDAHPDLSTLQRLLDTCGGDPARWPAGEEARMAGLLATDPRARAALAEARALDNVLALAPRVSEQRQRAMVDRIMAQVAKEPIVRHDVASSGNVVTLPSRARTTTWPPRIAQHRAGWQAAGLLAASLLAGVLGGATGVMSPALDEVAALAGLPSDNDVLTTALVPFQSDFDEDMQ